MLERPLQLDHPLLHLHEPLLVTDGAPTGVPDRPALAPWCRLAADDRRILVEHGGTVVTFEGRAVRALLPKLLPLLDGTRTVPEIEAELGRPAARAVENALAMLATNQLLVDGRHRPSDEAPATAAASFAAAVTRRTTQADALRALEQATVHVLGEGGVAEEIHRQLRLTGVGRVESRPLDGALDDSAFVVGAPERDAARGLATLNARALERRLPWLQVLPFDGRLAVVGPLFVPGASACRACYVLRRGSCSGYDDDYDLIDREPVRAPSPPPLAAIAAGLASLLTLRWLTTCDPALPGRFYAVESVGIVRLRYDEVLRVPRCSACGLPERAVPSPWFEEVA
jgi:bacteriocin biosynthesis cyclodehydratase domain-containing protein